MSGLENVLGNVYGGKDDQPQENDLSDVQESIDALTEVAAPGASWDFDDEGDTDDPTALDELSDWIGLEDEPDHSHSAHAAPVSADDADRISARGLPLLDGSNGDPNNDSSEEIENSEQSRAGWLDDLEGETSQNWMDELAEDETPSESPEFNEPEPVATRELADAIAVDNGALATGGEQYEDAGPTLDDLAAEDPAAEDPAAEDPAAEDPAAEDPPAEDPPAEDPPAEDPPAEDPAAEDPAAEDLAATAARISTVPSMATLPDEDQDEQWLNDLFATDADGATGTDLGHDTSVQATTVDANSPAEADVAPVQPHRAVAPDAKASAAVQPETENFATEPVSAVGINTGTTPAWEKLQGTTAAASASTSNNGTAPKRSNTTSTIALAGDWIRSDDDILPARGRAKRRARTLDIAELAPEQDPIELFAPADIEESKSRRFRRPKRNKSLEVADAEGDDSGEVAKAPRTTPELSETESVDGPEPAISEQNSPSQQPVDAETPASGHGHGSMAEVADPPVIAEVGMPQAPDAVEAFFVADDELAAAGQKKSKRKLFTRAKK